MIRLLNTEGKTISFFNLESIDYNVSKLRFKVRFFDKDKQNLGDECVLSGTEFMRFIRELPKLIERVNQKQKNKAIVKLECEIWSNDE